MPLTCNKCCKYAVGDIRDNFILQIEIKEKKVSLEQVDAAENFQSLTFNSTKASDSKDTETAEKLVQNIQMTFNKLQLNF